MIALLAVAVAAGPETEAERYLAWYVAGEHERLWEAATDRYRARTCLGRPEACPRLDTPLGTPIDRRFSCERAPDRCTLVRTDRYATPPWPGSEALELDWIVTTDLAGRFDGVAVDPREPGAGAAAAIRAGGVLCGMATTFLVVAGALFALLGTGRVDPPPPAASPADPVSPAVDS